MFVLFFNLIAIELFVFVARVIFELHVFEASQVSLVTLVYVQPLREYSTSLFPLALLQVPVSVKELEVVSVAGLVKVTYESENT
jgi:hypothetical protein